MTILPVRREKLSPDWFRVDHTDKELFTFAKGLIMEMEDDPPAGVPEWVVTYGDMMSLLLTFFIMLVSLSEVKADEKYRAILQSIEAYLGYAGGPLSPPGENFSLNSTLESRMNQELGSFTDQSLGYGGVKRNSTEGNDMRVFRMREGEKIQIDEPIVFPDDSSELTAISSDQLYKIVSKIAGKPQKIDILAHAGKTAYGKSLNAQERLRLAYHRGRNVQLKMEEMGIEHQRFRISIVPEDTAQVGNNDRIAEFSTHRCDVYLLDEYASELIGRSDD